MIDRNRDVSSRITRRQALGLMAAGAAAIALPSHARAAYPRRPIELVVCYGAGGTSDIYYRGLANILARELGQQFVVVNKSGAGSTIGTAYIANSVPDGHTVGNITEVMMRERLLGNGAFDPARDFTYIGVGASVPFGWAVRADSPIESLRQLVEEGRHSPEKLSYGAAGSARLPSWAMKVLESRTGARFMGVPFASSSAILTAALGGHIDLICDAVGAMAGAVAGGNMRMLAVSSEERLPQWRDVPTAKELGFDATTTLPYGVGGPAGMPADVVAVLEQALRKAYHDPEHQELIGKLNMASWIRLGSDFDSYMRTQYDALPGQLRAFGALNT
ncbi:tripartite tricarboxylate transporter substrate binding protein [Alcaligenaceae bacterium]|nr:tripartite tricarboxylate transporter substrate binding protein [Alcaligenaceae bacterium]